jgi:hypothetical protein
LHCHREVQAKLRTAGSGTETVERQSQRFSRSTFRAPSEKSKAIRKTSVYGMYCWSVTHGAKERRNSIGFSVWARRPATKKPSPVRCQRRIDHHAGIWTLKGAKSRSSSLIILQWSRYFARRLPRYHWQLVAISVSALRDRVCRKRVASRHRRRTAPGQEQSCGETANSSRTMGFVESSGWYSCTDDATRQKNAGALGGGTPANVLPGGGSKTIPTIEKDNDRLVKFAVSRLTPRRDVSRRRRQTAPGQERPVVGSFNSQF